MKKRIVVNLQVKLNRLRQLETQKNFQYGSLNDFSIFLNNVLSNINIDSISKISLLNKNDSAFLGTVPSNVEIEKLNELINKYSEALTFINPNHGKSIIGEFKEISNRFKWITGIINLSLLIGVASLFYNIGSKQSNNINADLSKKIIEQKNEIKTLLIVKDSLNKIIEVGNNSKSSINIGSMDGTKYKVIKNEGNYYENNK